MSLIFDPRIFPVLSFFISLSFGLTTWLLGASPSTSLILAVLVELVLIVHYSLSRIHALELLLGYTKGLAKTSELIPKINKILSDNNDKWRIELLNLKLNNFCLELTYIENRKTPLNADEFIELAEFIFTSLKNNDVLYATSLFGGGNYWNRKYGARYAELNKIATNNGAYIKRIFIPRCEKNYSDLNNIIKSQAPYCEIYTANPDDIKELDKNALKDFFVLNNELVAEFIFNHDFTELDYIFIITSKDEVENYLKKWKKILSISTRYDTCT